MGSRPETRLSVDGTPYVADGASLRPASFRPDAAPAEALRATGTDATDATVDAVAQNQKAYDPIVVENGIFTLKKARVKVNYGRPMTCDLETLDIDTPNGQTLADKRIIISNVGFYLNQSRIFWCGPNAPLDDENDPLQGLTELKTENLNNSDELPKLVTGYADVAITGKYKRAGSNGRVFCRHVDPTYLQILEVIPRGKAPIASGG